MTLSRDVDMSELYKLVFRGELIEGQHAAVVRRNLGQLLSIDDQRLDQLFSGQAVVVKAQTDVDSATRLQALFKKAGARLRVIPLVDAAAPVRAGGLDGVEVLPPGSEVLREDERQPWIPRNVATDHISLAAADGAPLERRDPAPPPPDTSHLSLLDPD
jgi:hypothetical protein